ncbi:sensory box histidine kinase/response regulator [Pseudooceanicola batsensis HTCC2597]|uniref:histidine kinase n=1 Tax=Pseudooceanicola batsensis (strain ATCC BAA-863 / DSM 15984 / KCTC 12145 / HTCC2597) TaxID=252305 RepID=A3TU98_PSEBH|nr:sensory box histidine kinase/response regulator [Pseudooceanicola batsensis HTCC2597]
MIAAAHAWSRAIALVVLAVAVLTLAAGWGAGTDFLVRGRQDWPAMVPTTAVSVMSLCLSQILLSSRRRSRVRAGHALVALTPLVAIVFMRTDPGILPVDLRPSDRMSDASLAAIVGLAAAQSAGLSRRAEDIRLHEWLAIPVIGLALYGLGGTLIDAGALVSLPFFEGLSVPSQLCFLLLGVSAIVVRPGGTHLSVLIDPGVGGRFVRRYMIWAIVAPIVLSQGAYLLTEAGVIEDRQRLVALATTLVILCCAGVLWAGHVQGELAQRDLRSREQLRAILSGLDAAIFVCATDGVLTPANRRAEEMTEAGPLRTMPLHAVSDRRPLTGARHPVERVIRDGADITAGWMHPDGQERILRLSSFQAALPDASCVVVVTDVSEPWHLQETLSQAERLDAVGQLAGGVSHEMLNVFGIIKLAVGGAQIRWPDLRDAPFAAILNACERGSAVAEKLQKLTAQPAAPVEIDAVAALGAAIDLVRKAVPSDIALHTSAPARSLTVNCDPVELEMTLVNLVLNARNALVEAGEREGEIVARVEERGGLLRFEVADNGPGIPADKLPRVTDAFFTTRRSRGGTGLGLATTAAFAEGSDGTFRLESTLGAGTVAILELPLSGGAPGAASEPEAAPQGLTDLRILVVEDDAQFQTLLADTLVLLGASVDRAASAREALMLLDSDGPFDVMITDHVLAGRRNGNQLARLAVRKCPDLSIVYLSGFRPGGAGSLPSVPGLVLRKPVTLAKLSHTVRLAVGAAGQDHLMS